MQTVHNYRVYNLMLRHCFKTKSLIKISSQVCEKIVSLTRAYQTTFFFQTIYRVCVYTGVCPFHVHAYLLVYIRHGGLNAEGRKNIRLPNTKIC